MTDNDYAYTKSAAFRSVLRSSGARHITTPPYTPQGLSGHVRLVTRRAAVARLSLGPPG
jgi:hypothetical protein